MTIVDTAGGESAATNTAIRYSDLCLIPTRPSIADIEATAATLRVIRAWHKPFAYVLNQTPIRAAARLAGAENALGDEAALDAADVLAQPFIVMRNDHQDALSAGLAVCEHAPGGKSAEEMRALWQDTSAKGVDHHGEFFDFERAMSYPKPAQPGGVPLLPSIGFEPTRACTQQRGA